VLYTPSNDIAIIVPTCGRPELERALRSVEKQSLDATNIKVLLIVDGVEYLEPVDKILDKGFELRISKFVLPYNCASYGGPARAAAVMLAQTEWVTFLDDDNWWEPDHLSKALNTAALFEVDWIVATRVIHTSDGQQLAVDPEAVAGHVDGGCHILKKELAVEAVQRYAVTGYMQDRKFYQRLRDLAGTPMKLVVPTMHYYARYDLATAENMMNHIQKNIQHYGSKQ
jgi:glycosyltransferase involved in cell wall biosynthesis